MILWKTSHSASEGDITMTAPSSIDPARFLHDQLESASPDLLRLDADHVHQRADVRRGRRGLRRPVRHALARSGSTSVTATGTGTSIPGPAPSMWRSRSCGQGSYFPDWLLERRRRAEAALTVGGGDLLSARGVDPADGEAGGVPRDHPAVQVAGQRDGPGSGRAGRGVPDPAAGRRARIRSSPPMRWCSKSARAAGW